jgi:hypothetical protein
MGCEMYIAYVDPKSQLYKTHINRKLINHLCFVTMWTMLFTCVYLWLLMTCFARCECQYRTMPSTLSFKRLLMFLGLPDRTRIISLQGQGLYLHYTMASAITAHTFFSWLLTMLSVSYLLLAQHTYTYVLQVLPYAIQISRLGGVNIPASQL